MDAHPATHATCITASDTEGRSVIVTLDSVLAIVPDPQRPHRTQLYVADGIVSVNGDYEHWMDRLSASWNEARA